MPSSTMDLQENIIDADARRMIKWSEIWAHRELFYFFTWRDIKIKYKQTMLGVVWVILQPLLMMLIITFFLGRALKFDSHELPYPVFVFSGLLIWNMFAAGLSNASNSMVSNSTIIKKIYFPRLVIPISSVLVALFDFLMASILFVPLLVFYDTLPTWNAIWCWPLAIIISVAATLGPGILTGALNVKYRDFRYVVPFAIQLLFFLTPVIYPPDLISNSALKLVIAVSPMYAPIELFRYALTSNELNWIYLSISITSCLVILVGGLSYFKRTESYFADFA
jgi:lipopolysaccharide transport system permease protein